MVVAYLRITINQLERRCPLNRRKQEVGKVVGGQLGPVYRLDRDLKGILPQKKFYRLNLIFWIVIGCGMAGCRRRGQKTSRVATLEG